MSRLLQTGSLVVGGGPAGLAPLLAASRRGILPDLISRGVVVAERGARIGGGRIGRYVINSDSAGATFLSCLHDSEPLLAAVARTPTAAAVAAYGDGAVPLALVGRLLEDVGEALRQRIEADPSGAVLTGHEALRTTMRPQGGWLTQLRSGLTGRIVEVASDSVILATGGDQPHARLAHEEVAGRPLLPRYRDKLLQSDAVLSNGGLDLVARRLDGIAQPRIVIVGGSTSALACARLLLGGLDPPWPPGAITLMHRRPLTVFYPSAAAARADGYDAFRADDVCPISGFVFRFGGLRFDSRELVMRLSGIGGRPAENRIVLHSLEEQTSGCSRALLDGADLIVSCLGYRPRALKVFDAHGAPIALRAEQPDGALVGAQCGVLDAAGDEIPGLLGIGLAAGFVAHASMGGEKSFRGQMNGLWLWQNDIGVIVAHRMLAAACAPAPEGVAPERAAPEQRMTREPV
ncbi:aminotransferase DegT [Lichenicoccus sp.]|uniref:aminotransferase DegT n=1 Tax=Lichenicoccus sp. TaxID=2781899 RepID=UPI003D0AE383